MRPDPTEWEVRTRYFSLDEWSNPDWDPYPECWIGPRWYPLAETLDVIREAWGKPLSLTPNGGYRSAAHNRATGGSKRSQHMLGRAADLRAPRGQSRKLWNLIWRLRREGKLPLLSGVGLYKSFVHVDVGGPRRKDGTPRRWVSLPRGS